VDVDEPENELIYNIALEHSLLSTANVPFFSYITPLVELNGITVLNGPESDRTVLNVTPGVRWAISEEGHAGVGVSLPISGSRDFDSRFVFSYIRHF